MTGPDRYPRSVGWTGIITMSIALWTGIITVIVRCL